MQKNTRRPCLIFVVGMEPTKIGGVEKFLRALAVGLDRCGWDSVLCFEKTIIPEYRDFFALPCIHLEILNGQQDLGLDAAGDLWKLLRRYRPQVFVYAFNGVMRCFPWLARAAGCKRIFFNDHSSRAPGMVASAMSAPKRFIGRTLTAPLDAIISVSGFTRDTGTAFGISSARNVVVSNGIEMQAPNPALRQPFRARYSIPEDAVVVASVCWMVEVKGVDVLLHAAATLLPRYPHARFLFVGDGARRNEYIALAEELGIAHAVLFPGIISDPVGAGVYDASDLYCQPSLWQESFGLAVVEAMSKKLPVVASSAGALPELVLPEQTGLLAAPGDVAGFAAALERLIADTALRQRMGETACASVIDRYRVENMVQGYLDQFLPAAFA